MHPIPKAEVELVQGLIVLLAIQSACDILNAEGKVTDVVVFAQTDQPEADGEHARMGENCNCGVRVLERGNRIIWVPRGQTL